MNLFRQSTVVTRRIGPAMDSTGAEYTGLVIGDLTLTKNGTSAAMAAAATLTHIANGHYSLVTIAGNTDTVGSLRIDCNKAGYQIPVVEGHVVEEAVYDALFAASANTFSGAAGSTTLGSALINAAALAPDTGIKPIRTGTLQAAGAGTATLDAGASSTTNVYILNRLVTTGGTGAGQNKIITLYNGTTKVATVVPASWAVTPDNTTTFAIVPDGNSSIASLGQTSAAGLEVMSDQYASNGRLQANVETWNYVTVGNLPTNFDALLINASGHVSRVTLTETLTTYTGNTPQTGDVATLITTVGVAGAGLTAADDAVILAIAALNNLSSAQAQTAAAAALTAYDPPTQAENLAAHATTDAAIAAMAARLPARITKNTALAAFPFKMVLDSDGKTPATGLTVTATRSLDGGAFAACANAATEVGGGIYVIDLAAGDLNGTTVTLRFAGTLARTIEIVAVTQP